MIFTTGPALIITLPFQSGNGAVVKTTRHDSEPLQRSYSNLIWAILSPPSVGALPQTPTAWLSIGPFQAMLLFTYSVENAYLESYILSTLT